MSIGGSEMNRTINADDLMDALRIGTDCETCPRYDGLVCKGHLSWVCKRIRELIEEEDNGVR